MKSILDPAFQYTPSWATNLSEKFKRMAEEKQAAAAPKQELAERYPVVPRDPGTWLDKRSPQDTQDAADTARIVTIMESRRIAK